MTPVFGHGRLRLYLLKLLDESPRHGYEIIRLLQDRFLGLYAPSAGTVYPRLAKLEQEGLVTHSVEGGRKVYRITEAGRAELAERRPELDALETEIRESVYERAREIRDEVRTSARNLREELRQAARDMQGGARGGPAAAGGKPGSSARSGGKSADEGKDDPVSAWAKNIGPALSQKMVDLAEGLAQGLAGLTESHTQHLEEELRRHFGTDPAAGTRGHRTVRPTGGKRATGYDGKSSGGTAAKAAPEADDAWGAETDRSPGEPESGCGPEAADPAGTGLHELSRLFDCFRTRIDAVAECAGLSPSQVDRARDVIVRAYTELNDIVNDR
jgi:DNA-binding PadR family transcriptional regulator